MKSPNTTPSTIQKQLVAAGMALGLLVSSACAADKQGSIEPTGPTVFPSLDARPTSPTTSILSEQEQAYLSHELTYEEAHGVLAMLFATTREVTQNVDALYWEESDPHTGFLWNMDQENHADQKYKRAFSYQLHSKTSFIELKALSNGSAQEAGVIEIWVHDQDGMKAYSTSSDAAYCFAATGLVAGLSTDYFGQQQSFFINPQGPYRMHESLAPATVGAVADLTKVANDILAQTQAQREGSTY